MRGFLLFNGRELKPLLSFFSNIRRALLPD
jgi:hypothetical protein